MSLTIYTMGAKGFAVLKCIHELFPSVLDQVVTARDTNTKRDWYDEINTYCREHRIPVVDRREPTKISPDSDYAFAVSWRWLISLDPSRLIVFHDSLLPRYRGFNPLVSALINGDSEIGVTALYASERYDEGEIISQSSRTIEYPMKIATAISLITEDYCRLAKSILTEIMQGRKPNSRPQNKTEISYSLWRDEDDYAVDWTGSASQIERFVDACGDPYKGASCSVAGIKARILEAKALEDIRIENRTAGKVIFIEDGRPVVVCGQGLLRIDGLTDDATDDDLLPLKRFRTRFSSLASPLVATV